MDDKLRTLQLTQLEMLKTFDSFCREHGLHYSLYAGTLLGAVRHRGFIPWDDDLDVCMARSEYDLFIELWQKTSHPGYILHNKENTPTFSQSFTKLRKDHTAFLQSKEEAGAYHTGIFIDIFPIDRVPSSKLSRWIFKWNCMKYQLLTREHIPPKSGAVIRFACALILLCAPKRFRAAARQRLLKKITQHDSDETLETIAIEVMSTINCPLAADMLHDYTHLPFEDGKFMCFAGWDEYLRRKYNDYMHLPPEKDRVWKHHPLLIDFEHNYEELRDDES